MIEISSKLPWIQFLVLLLIIEVLRSPGLPTMYQIFILKNEGNKLGIS
jgi:hypothetical protein